MKKPLIIGVSALTLLAVSATLFAQTTTGSSLITQMKAATHAFTLSADLNSGATGLESSPLVGKRTGDMLTAAEYNRLLELVGQGGGGGGSDIVLAHGSKKTAGGSGTVSLTDTISLNQRGLLIISGDAVRRYVGAVYNAGLIASISIDGQRCGSDMSFEGESTTVNFHGSPSCIQMLEPGNHTITFDNSATGSPNTLPISTSMSWAVIAEKGGSGGGGGSGWTDIDITGTSPFNKSCAYRFTRSIDGANSTYHGANPYYYVNAVSDTEITWWFATSANQIHHISASNKTVYKINGVAYAPAGSVTKIQENCGGGGGGGTTESSTSWITFDGTTTTPTVKSKSGNISGIQRYTNSGSGVGRYEILFNPAMPNVNYAISANAQATSSGGLNTYICGYHDKTVNSVKITVCNITNAIDSPDVSVTVHK